MPNIPLDYDLHHTSLVIAPSHVEDTNMSQTFALRGAISAVLNKIDTIGVEVDMRSLDARVFFDTEDGVYRATATVAAKRTNKENENKI